MMKFFFNFYITFILLVIYASTCALGTFVENDFGVWDAKILIYNTAFFNALHALIFVNLAGLIVRFRMWKKPASFAFHSAILLIIAGAAITRFWGLEASLHIQNEQLSSVAISQDQHIIIISDKNGSVEQSHFPIFISPLKNYAELFENYLPAFIAKPLGFVFGDITQGFVPQKLTLNGDEISIKFDEFKPAMPPVTHFPMIKLSVSEGNETISKPLAQNFFDESLTEFNFGDNAILLSWGARFIKLPFAVFLESLKVQNYPGSTNPSSHTASILLLENNTSQEATLSMSKITDFNGYRLFLSSLDEDKNGAFFTVNKDPGKLITYVGYFVLFAGLILSLFARNGRFVMLCKRLSFVFALALVFYALPLQAELEANSTILSPSENNANSANLNDKNALNLSENATNLNENALNLSTNATSNESNLNLNANALNSSAQNSSISDEILAQLRTSAFKSHATNFAKIPVLSYEGRVKPFGALTLDLINKISHKSSLYGLSHKELVLGAMLYYDEFMQIPLIRVRDERLKAIIGTDKDYICVEDVYKNGVYKLKDEVANAQNHAGQKSPYQKDVLSVDEAVNLLIATSRGEVLRIFADKTRSEWLSPSEAIQNLDISGAGEVQGLLESYFNALANAIQSGDFSKANAALSELKDYQLDKGAFLMPNAFTLWAENLLLDLDAFANLGKFYAAFGVLLLLCVLVLTARGRELSAKFKLGVRGVFYASFALFVLAFGLRWFIGTHAVWSNAYESMLLIGVVLALLTLVLSRNLLFLALGAFGVGVILCVANLGFMDPQITPLMPVLQSYWLNIHVSTITASYAFFVMAYLSSLAGLVGLVCRAKSVPNLAVLTEIVLALGLVLLVIGTFLGGIWANESWGRYWGWDPKETWSLILAVVYMLVLHARFLPRLNSPFALFCGACVGFFVMLMTYFGVNYFLSGKHSYATGESNGVPLSVFVLMVLNLALMLTAWLRSKVK